MKSHNHRYGPPAETLTFTRLLIKAISEGGNDIRVETDQGWLVIGIGSNHPMREMALAELTIGEHARLVQDPADRSHVIAIGYRQVKTNTVTRALVARFCDITVDTVNLWCLQATPWRAAGAPRPPIMPSIMATPHGTLFLSIHEGRSEDGGRHALTMMGPNAIIQELPETILTSLAGKPFDEIVSASSTKGLGLTIAHAENRDGRTVITIGSEDLELFDPGVENKG